VHAYYWRILFGTVRGFLAAGSGFEEFFSGLAAYVVGIASVGVVVVVVFLVEAPKERGATESPALGCLAKGQFFSRTYRPCLTQCLTTSGWCCVV